MNAKMPQLREQRNWKKPMLALAACGLLLFPCPGQAQQPKAAGQQKQGGADAVTMGEVLVTATRTEKDLSSAPGSFSVVGKKEIASRNIKSLDEALNSTVGVFNDSKGKGLMGTTTSVSMRGLSSDKRALFLLDGITPLNDGYDGSVSYQLQSVENIERIEVVKGPFSSLYGGNAMAGVVNIITRMPEKRELTVKTGYGSSFERGEGLDDLSKFYVSYGDRLNERLSLLASYGTKATNGYATALNVQTDDPAAEGISGALPTASTSGAKRHLIGDSGDNTWEDDQLTLKAKYDVSRSTKLNFGYMRRAPTTTPMTSRTPICATRRASRSGATA